MAEKERMNPGTGSENEESIPSVKPEGGEGGLGGRHEGESERDVGGEGRGGAGKKRFEGGLGG